MVQASLELIIGRDRKASYLLLPRADLSSPAWGNLQAYAFPTPEDALAASEAVRDALPHEKLSIVSGTHVPTVRGKTRNFGFVHYTAADPKRLVAVLSQAVKQYAVDEDLLRRTRDGLVEHLLPGKGTYFRLRR